MKLKLYFIKPFENYESVKSIGLCDMNINFMNTKPISNQITKWKKYKFICCPNLMITKDNLKTYLKYYDKILLSSIKADVRIKIKNININISLYDPWRLKIANEIYCCDKYSFKKLEEEQFFKKVFNVNNIKVFLEQVHLKLYMLMMFEERYFNFIDYYIYNNTPFQFQYINMYITELYLDTEMKFPYVC